ncbi:MAG TPA: desulfoferrodoxin [Spirochaetales bacterium]|nr:desulfoferrodoxin [Spirochaetales bacterium]HPS15129.1 desulfoferrodoxin [Spirochaetales bacterium]
MTELRQIYKCNVCGNIVEVVHPSGGTLVCCGQPMTLMVENSVDAAKEKHVPVIESTPDGFWVLVGAVAHPMEQKHYIEWIELIADDRVYRAYLKPGDEPKAFFPVKAENVSAREYCSLHGLWKS